MNHTVFPVEKSIEYIKDQLATVWKEGEKIPGCRVLAERIGVSIGTIQKAIKNFEQKKLLTCKAKVGIYAGKNIPQNSQHKSEKTRIWKVVCNRLKNDIFHGLFQTSEFLPSLKELASEYGVDFRTLQKAIVALVDEGLLSINKRRYRITHFLAKVNINTVVCIMDEQNFRGELWSTDKMFLEQFLQGLEQECSLKNITLLKHCYGQPLKVDNRNVLGFIVWHSDRLNDHDHAISAMLGKYHKPVAVLLYLGSTSAIDAQRLVKTYSDKPLFFVSSINADAHAGSKMGTFLLGKGHKKICCFGNSYNELWIQETCAGLASVLTSKARPGPIVSLFMDTFPQSEYASYITQEDRLAREAIVKEVEVLDSCSVQVREHIDNAFVGKIGIQLQEARFSRHALTYYKPLLRKALTLQDVSAWIFFDDYLAIYGALAFCKSEGIKVPGKIGIVGMSNLPEASFCSLTTYHTDFAGAARKMLTMIIYPEHARKTLCLRGTTMFEIDGMVIDRGSA